MNVKSDSYTLTCRSAALPYPKHGRRHRRRPCGVLVNIYVIFILGGDSLRSFFSSRPQYAILGTGIVGQIDSFERRLQGAAQTPLALTYPFRTWPYSGTWAERDEREVRKFFVFWAVYARASLGSWPTKSLNEKNMWENIYFQIGFLLRPHHTFFMATPRSVLPIVHIVRLNVVPFLFDIGFQG